MSTYLPPDAFRFLDLPAELRNNVYDLLLCSWQQELQLEPGHVGHVSKRCPSYAAASLLRVSRQIHSEARDYMIKRNQFVRISCRGFDVRDLFLEAGIPVVTTSARAANQFNGHVMHLTLSKPVFSSSPLALLEYDMMILSADLPTLCKRLDVESIMIDANTSTHSHTAIKATVNFPWQHARFFTPTIQQRLLAPIAELVRGVPDLQIRGPVDRELAASVIEQVALPRWTDPEATLGDIHTGVDVGKRQWQQDNAYIASECWTFALRTLERMRHSSSWQGLQQAGGLDFVNKTADLYFTLNLFHAAFLQVDMASAQASPALIQRNGAASLLHLRKCSAASARFAQHTGSTWTPSNRQSGKMAFRQAKCLRLMRHPMNRGQAVTLIETAASLAPNEVAIREEKDAIDAWSAGILAEQEAASARENASLWSSIVASVVEWAA